MKFKWVLCLSSVLSLTAFAEDAFLRIQSDSENSGARIFINGTFKGECPLDVAVESGKLEIVAVKTVDAEYEQRWSQVVNMGDGAIKRIQVQLSAPQLTAPALRARQIANYEKNKAAAEAGNSDAMLVLAELYEQGSGTDQNLDLAKQWREKAKINKEMAAAQKDLNAAEKGDIPAMGRIAARYEEGKGVEKNSTEAEMWRAKKLAAQNQVDEALRQQQQKDDAERTRVALQNKLDSISYFSQSQVEKAYFDENYDSNFGTILLLYIPSSFIGLSTDLVMTPTKITQKRKLSKQLKAHAAAWANPDSMMGQATGTRAEERTRAPEGRTRTKTSRYKKLVE